MTVATLSIKSKIFEELLYSMKQIRTALLGFGNRGGIYADHSLDYPDEMKIVAVIEINVFRLEEARQRYGLSEDQAFTDLDEFLKRKIPCDLVINAVMDEMHYVTAMKILKAGYDMLLEKPITPNPKELLEIRDTANENGCNVFVGHVLRYTPFYSTIKDMIEKGELGQIYSIEMDEHVALPHFIDSFVRGKWHDENECGSPLILAKCCHDTDLMCWLNSKTEPRRVYSFGSQSKFKKENKPEGAVDFCYRCQFENTCVYSATKMHLDFDCFPFQTWEKIRKPLDEITREEKAEFLKHDNYGRCVYDAGFTLVDRQSLTVEFENGSIANFTLVGATAKGERYIAVASEKGEIKGYFESGLIHLYKTVIQEDGKYVPTDTVIDVNSDIVSNIYGGHGGGDFALIRDIIRFLNGERDNLSITSINDSVKGHLICYAAEESRKTGSCVIIND